jgi:class 3 adenylate cyclase
MLKVAVGHREGQDVTSLLAQVLADARAQLGETPVLAGVITVAGDFDPLRIADGLTRALPGVPIVGITSSGDLSSQIGVSEDSINLLLFAADPADEIRFSAGLGTRASVDPEAAAAEALTMAAPDRDTWLCFAFPDSRKPGTGALVAALEAQLPRGCALFGGKLGGQWDRWSAPRAQFFNGQVVHDSLPVLLCEGALGYDFRVIQGWTPVGPRQLVRAAEGSRVLQIGDRSAVEFYNHYFGPQSRPLPEFPLAVHAGDDGFYVRTPIRSDPATGHVDYSGEVPQGAEVQLCEAIREHLLAETSRSVAELGVHALGGAGVRLDRAPPWLRPAAVLVFSCAARKQILGTRTASEVEAVTRALPGVPVFGFYAGGEIAPLVPGGRARLHNATMVTLVIGTCSERQPLRTPTPAPAPAPAPAPDPALLQRRLERAESYRVRAEDAKELSTTMLRTIGAEVEATRRQIAAQNDELRRLYGELTAEKHKSDALLQNILPVEVAEELKRTGQVRPVHYDSVTVLFTDFKGFTRVASRLRPEALLRELDFYFSEFDRITERHGLEKLKTIGDAYMCAGGIPQVNSSHALDAVAAAWDILQFMEQVRADKLAGGEQPWELRIGVHTGPLMAGVIGHKKFAYDIWGDTVNIASRLESTGEAGRINISRATWEAVRDRFECEYRGKLTAKNRGEVDMYFVVGPR